MNSSKSKVSGLPSPLRFRLFSPRRFRIRSRNCSGNASAPPDSRSACAFRRRGFPFRRAYKLEELDAMRLGPESIKKRVRLQSGNLMLKSRPGQVLRLLVSLPL